MLTKLEKAASRYNTRNFVDGNQHLYNSPTARRVAAGLFFSQNSNKEAQICRRQRRVAGDEQRLDTNQHTLLKQKTQSWHRASMMKYSTVPKPRTHVSLKAQNPHLLPSTVCSNCANTGPYRAYTTLTDLDCAASELPANSRCTSFPFFALPILYCAVLPSVTPTTHHPPDVKGRGRGAEQCRQGGGATS